MFMYNKKWKKEVSMTDILIRRNLFKGLFTTRKDIYIKV